MPAPDGKPRSFQATLVILLGSLVLLVAGAEYWAPRATSAMAAPDASPAAVATGRLASRYLDLRAHAVSRALVYGPMAVLGPGLLYALLARLARSRNEWRDRKAGFAFQHESYALAHPFERRGSGGTMAATQDAFVEALVRHETARGDERAPAPALLGFDAKGAPVTISERARSMHVHLLGQTGSGKTQSVIYPLLYQDARAGRPLVFLDAKGSMENEEMLAAIAAATGRREGLRIFTLNPGRSVHTFNPLYMVSDAEPRQVAERVFSTFESDLDVQYYKDMARELWVALVMAVASSGKQATMLDLAAAIAEPEVMIHALSLADDRAAVQTIKNRYAQLEKARKLSATYTGLLAAVRRYDHPALNTYNPDIVLEDLLDAGGIVGFSLSANAYKFQARAVGLIVLQHLQHIGALRQMDRTRNQDPLYVYADEFYSFAYEGFIDAVNKLRDARVSMLLAHQDLSDLDRVSAEFARGVWGNTRNKIVLYQSDPELCERLAAAAGTRKATKHTKRVSVDGFLQQASTLESSAREVDEYVLHPNRLKALRTGQAYLVQTGVGDGAAAAPPWWCPWARPAPPEATRVVGVNLAPLKPLPPAEPPAPAPRDTDSGIGLHKLFLEQQGFAL
jgi:hypothetical protein